MEVDQEHVPLEHTEVSLVEEDSSPGTQPMAVDNGTFAEDDFFPMEDDYEEAPMEWHDDAPPDEDFDEPSSQPMAVDDTIQTEAEQKSEERRLGAHGRRRAKDMVARKANCKAKANKKVLQSRFDKIDKQPNNWKSSHHVLME